MTTIALMMPVARRVRLDTKGLVEIGPCVAESTAGAEDGRVEADSVTEHTPFTFLLTFLRDRSASSAGKANAHNWLLSRDKPP